MSMAPLESLKHVETGKLSKSGLLPRAISPGMQAVVRHSLFWLVVGNAIGVLIATLLLVPGLNPWLGEWTYGRWIMVHMNLLLYGWCSLPMVGFLFYVYGVDCGAAAQWARPVVWAWSVALGIGSFSWLSGHSSGKLFLDWSGIARIYFPLAMTALWVLLAVAMIRFWNVSVGKKREANKWGARAGRIAGLVLLAAVPPLIFIASSPGIYPAFNPDTGGPTGASQLESSLVVVAILLALPFGLTRRKQGGRWALSASWVVLLAEAALCVALGRTDISHHRPAQFLSLGSLLVWLPLTPVYYAAFEWHPATRRWRNAFFCWWGLLVVSGWVLFLPGVLDRFKFTDGLVGHSLTAEAGFVTALLIFVMIQLLGEDGWIFNGSRAFYAWNYGVLAYVALMTIAGWIEGANPAFTIVPGLAREAIYLLRLFTGVAMLTASVDWLRDARRLGREAQSRPGSLITPERALEKTA
jgi:cytochrome c oxidase cbb3-type subunit 1